MIAKGAITKRANAERLPAATIERDYVLAQLCADIGASGDGRLAFKGGTLLRLCYFADYRDDELGEYLTINIPHSGHIERRTRKLLAPVLAAARAHADTADA